jgi:hypothetical protein
VECHEQRTEHVEGCHEDRNKGQPENQGSDETTGTKSVSEDLVLAPETGEGEHTGETQAAYHESGVGYGHELAKAAHISHVESAGGMVDAA